MILQKTQLNVVVRVQIFLGVDLLHIAAQRNLSGQISAVIRVDVIVIAGIERLQDFGIAEPGQAE
ncbi:hypothetical protein D3C80_2106780 [compost metagenome]